MPAILVASKMKSGLPKPVHSASPIVHIPAARTVPQPCYLKFGNKVEVNKSSYASQIPLKSQNGHENAGDGFLRKKSSSIENGFDTQSQMYLHKDLLHGSEGENTVQMHRSQPAALSNL